MSQVKVQSDCHIAKKCYKIYLKEGKFVNKGVHFLFTPCNSVVPTIVEENHREYLLPHGWKKICEKRKYKEHSERWNFILETPEGKKFRKNKDLNNYLDKYPNVKCVRSVTNFSRPSDLDRKWDMNRKNSESYEGFLPEKLPLPPDISGDPLLDPLLTN